jgi:hypothetical protein
MKKIIKKKKNKQKGINLFTVDYSLQSTVKGIKIGKKKEKKKKTKGISR